MSDLIAFVNARLDEIQRDAEAAAKRCGCHPATPEWSFTGDEGNGRIVVEGNPHTNEKRALTRRWNNRYVDMFDARHIVRHDPKAVLADIKFKRDLLELFAISNEEGFGGADGWVLIRDAVYNLAALWSDHEDYNPDWRTNP